MQNIILLRNANSKESLQLKNSKEANTENHCIAQFLQFGAHVKVLMGDLLLVSGWSPRTCVVESLLCSFAHLVLLHVRVAISLLPWFAPFRSFNLWMGKWTGMILLNILFIGGHRGCFIVEVIIVFPKLYFCQSCPCAFIIVNFLHVVFSSRS